MKPLIVDLDGTLTKSDLLDEAIAFVAISKPWLLPKMILLLILSKVKLKNFLANSYCPNIERLPLNEKVVSFCKDEKKKNRKIILVSASHQEWIKDFPKVYPFIDEAFGTTNEKNLKGKEKRDFLENKFSKKGFDYIGNSLDDLHVWHSSEHAYSASRSNSLNSKIKNLKEKLTESSKPWIKRFLKQIRVHQWTKNLLIFSPIFFARGILEPDLLSSSVIAFFCFCSVASFIYILNDIVDLNADRSNPIKKGRPFASGTLSHSTVLLVGAVFCIVSLAVSFFFLSTSNTIILLSYIILNLYYSRTAKNKPILDVFLITSFFLLRILSGSIGIEIELSNWFAAFSIFFFLGLAMGKRYSELLALYQLEGKTTIEGRGYKLDDLSFLKINGVSSGYISILVYLLYVSLSSNINSTKHIELFWLVGFILLFWQIRIWFLISRGEIKGDPLKFAMKDKMSLALAVAMISILGLGYYL